MSAAHAGPGARLEVLTTGADALGVTLTSDQLDQCAAFLTLLAEWNRRAALTSPAALADAERVHLLDSLSLVPLVQRHAPDATSLVDVGTGPGLPGLVLKIAIPGLRVTLVESVAKKTAFLRAVVDELGLADVEVVERRAEEAGRDPALRGAFDVATARALAALPVVMELTMPFLRVGGVLLAQRGTDASDAEVGPVAKELGGRIETVEQTTTAGFDAHAVVVVRQERPAPERYPRRTGIPVKRPLGGRSEHA